MRSICIILSVAMVCQAQQVSGPKQNLVQAGGIKIVAVQGEGAINNIRAKTATQPVVEVRDDQDKPIPGAEVVFQLPAAGPGGVFNGWMRNQTARTNEQGQAAASGLAPNDEEGRFNIKVTATSGTKTGTLIMGQSNARGPHGDSAKAKSSRKKLWITLAVLGAAGIIGGVVAANGNDDSSSGTTTSVPVTVSPGPVTIGGPR